MPLEFTLNKEIGSAPLGTLWEAQEYESGRNLLIKRIPMKAIGWGRNGWASMLDEIRELSRIQHRALASVLELREEGEELLSIGWKPEGKNLAVIAAEVGGLDANQIRQWVIPVLEALALTHDRGIVHRHVHESLIFIDSTNRPRIHGFGLSLTQAIEVETIPPELLNGGRASAASDQYLAAAMLQRVTSEDVLDSPLRIVLDKALSEKASGRFGDMLDFMDALSAGLPETPSVTGVHQSAPALDSEQEEPAVEAPVGTTPVSASESNGGPEEGAHVVEAPAQPEQDLHSRPSSSRKWASKALGSAVVLLILIGAVLFSVLRGEDRSTRQGQQAVLKKTSALERIHMQLEAGKVKEAKDGLEQVIQDGSTEDKLEAMEVLGTIRLQEQAPQEAALLFRQVLGKTSSEQLYYKLALAEAAQGLDAEALRSLDEGLRLFPDSQRLLEARRQLGGV